MMGVARGTYLVLNGSCDSNSFKKNCFSKTYSSYFESNMSNLNKNEINKQDIIIWYFYINNFKY